MSDLQKAIGYAEMLGQGTMLQLRWEGSGDSVHAAELINGLCMTEYRGTNQWIKFHATVNLYEGADTKTATAACENLTLALTMASAGQTAEIFFNVDLTRSSNKLDQPKAHIIFVRNIMIVSEGGGSAVTKKTELLNLHAAGIRNRSKSLSGPGSSIRLGVSGFPGLVDNKNQSRDERPVEKLFYGFPELEKSATQSGLQLEGLPSRPGGSDKDSSVGVMKNTGEDLGVKPTYYLTFQSPNK